jgi:uncharacterized protein DUF1629
MNYLIERVSRTKGACLLGSIKGVKEDFNLTKGVSRAAGWPADAFYRMSPKYPKDIKLDDFLESMDTLLVVSDRVRGLLESERMDGVEFLPLSIVNHKDRKEPAPYFLVNIVGLQDCVDMTKTTRTVSPLDPELWITVQNLTLDPSRIEPRRELFRARYIRSATIWSEDLANKALAKGFTGIRFLKPSDYHG